jgi:hypothetical protein
MVWCLRLVFLVLNTHRLVTSDLIVSSIHACLSSLRLVMLL